MNDLRFETYADFRAALASIDIEQAIPEFVQLLERDYQPDCLDGTLIRAFDSPTLRKYKLLPLTHHQGTLYLGAVQASEDFQAFLQSAFACPVRLFSISDRLFERFESSLTAPALPAQPESSPPVAQVFQRLLEAAQQSRASDIHLEPQHTGAVLVRFRIDGLLHDIETLESTDFDYRARLVSKIKVAADLDIAETRIPQDGRITEHIRGEPVDLRVSTLPSMHGEKIVIRLLPHKNPFQQMRDLGLEGEALITYYNWVKKPQGMVLITGQTGSGKTSTLYTTLSQIVHTEKNIITIEDPIEYKLAGVTQVQVHPKVGLTFASGLRSILRQDPDIILLGEIRDRETAEIAYQAALTGHLVLSTLHTNDAPSAIIRLMDMNVEPYLIVSATLGVVAQRLVRKICPHCAYPYTPAQDLLRSLGLPVRAEDYTFYRASGCEQCFNTGYYGREGIFEVMPVDDELSGLIQQKDQLAYIRAHLQQRKIQSLFESAISKVQQGLTTVEEVLRVVPPTQRKASGSIFVFMLFLISILSILILNGFSVFEGATHTLRMQQQSIQGTYAAHSALQVGQHALASHLQAGRLYFLPDNRESSENPLLAVSELSPLFSGTGKVILEPGHLDGRYQLSAKPVKIEQQGRSRIWDYGYDILAKGVANDREDQNIAPRQRVTGSFQLQTGSLPLSFFERFAVNGVLPLPNDAPGQGPYYSEERPGEGLPATDLANMLPEKGYYTAAEPPFGKEIVGLRAGQPLRLPQSLWPEIGDPTADQNLHPGRPAIALTPIAPGMGASYPILPFQAPEEKTFNPERYTWALSIDGDVDRLNLNAGPEIQSVTAEQLAPGQSGSPGRSGYQDITLHKTTLIADSARKRLEITLQQWRLTLNPQHRISRQKLENANRLVFPDHFSGLVRVNGAIHQLFSDGPSYSRPLSIFATDDIGIVSTLRKADRNAFLGLITQEGRIAFEPVQKPIPADWLADWSDHPPKALLIEAAIAAGRLTLPEKTAVTVRGSVAILKSPFPAGLKTEYNPDFYSLNRTPPFFPVLNTHTPALLVTRPCGKSHWREAYPP